MNKNLKTLITELHSKGYSYRQIQKELQCSKGTISYHLGEGQVEKTRNRTRSNMEKSPIVNKLSAFRNLTHRERHRFFAKATKFHSEDGKHRKSTSPTVSFTPQDVIDKYGNVCYLTGREIDLTKASEFHLDHIIPRSKGGDFTLENCGLACKEANRAKSDLSLEEFFQLCVDVVKHNKLLE